jgi:hypothetical protein
MKRLHDFLSSMPPRAALGALAATLIVAACAGTRPSTRAPGDTVPRYETAPPASAPQSPPVPLPATAPIAADPGTGSAPSLASAAPSAQSPFAFAPHIPSGTLYVCAARADGAQTPIEYEPKVRDLCARHPEMGVCQYGRDACRASGGRVYDASGAEITRAIEAEYDRKVMRVRLRS